MWKTNVTYVSLFFKINLDSSGGSLLMVSKLCKDGRSCFCRRSTVQNHHRSWWLWSEPQGRDGISPPFPRHRRGGYRSVLVLLLQDTEFFITWDGHWDIFLDEDLETAKKAIEEEAWRWRTFCLYCLLQCVNFVYSFLSNVVSFEKKLSEIDVLCKNLWFQNIVS